MAAVCADTIVSYLPSTNIAGRVIHMLDALLSFCSSSLNLSSPEGMARISETVLSVRC